jgi:outer membrane protein assembly factor BamD (BamD/ComL family)
MLVLLLVISCFAGCAIFAKKPGPELSAADSFFQERRYTEALTGYRKVLSRPRSSEHDVAAARYAIAFTLSYYDNPHKNYAQALEEFEEFLRLYPNHEKAAEALNWKNVLKTLLEEKRECEQLKKKIEELKRLDIRHEEKRKGK